MDWCNTWIEPVVWYTGHPVVRQFTAAAGTEFVMSPLSQGTDYIIIYVIPDYIELSVLSLTNLLG